MSTPTSWKEYLIKWTDRATFLVSVFVIVGLICWTVNQVWYETLKADLIKAGKDKKQIEDILGGSSLIPFLDKK